jgi:hypothetical protein
LLITRAKVGRVTAGLCRNPFMCQRFTSGHGGGGAGSRAPGAL